MDMAELVPDAWHLQEEEEIKCCNSSRCVPRRGPVTDFSLLVECYAALTAILTSQYPEKAPKLMAYLRTITQAQRSYVGDGWVTYDTCFRYQAAVPKSLDWSHIDQTSMLKHLPVEQKQQHGVATASANFIAPNNVCMPSRMDPTLLYQCWITIFLRIV